MSKHLPECFASLCECDDTHFTSIDCDYSCICDELRACEQRVLTAARKAVAALPAPFKARGDFDTYGPYNEGRMDMKDSALAAIDALRGESNG